MSIRVGEHQAVSARGSIRRFVREQPHCGLPVCGAHAVHRVVVETLEFVPAGVAPEGHRKVYLVADAIEEVERLKEAQFRLKFRSATETVDNPLQFRVMRRNIARMITILRERTQQ